MGNPSDTEGLRKPKPMSPLGERELPYIREQDKVTFTALLISLILQQYKIGFKVELKYTKVMVKERAAESADERLFRNCRWANGASDKNGK